jgi:hypothetical protein
MTYPTGEPFSVLFEPTRFDLVYGRGQERRRYFLALTGAKKAALMDAFVMIDNYNNTLGISAVDTFADAADAQRFGNVVKDRVKLKFPTGRTGELGQRKAEELNRYARALLHSHYSPGVVASQSDDELAKQGCTNRQQNIQWKVIRAACKFGIEYVVKHSPPNRRIHFALDGISDRDVLVKTEFTCRLGQQAVPITTSELRSVYRNWSDEYSEKVWFYRNFMCVPPPWETSQDWDEYASYRWKKYLAKLEAAKQDNPGLAQARAGVINKYLEAAADCQQQQRYRGAIMLLKEATTLLTGEAPRGKEEGVAADVGVSGQTLAAHVRSILDDYDAQGGLFRRESQKSRDASARLRQLLGNHVDLARAVRHYLDLDTRAGARVGGGVTVKLDKSSTLYEMLLRAYRAWLGLGSSLHDVL